jgi:radical SAM-linked protein
MYRVKYTKEGMIKFISHLDLIRLWHRAFRRAGIRVRMSQGFSPHPIMAFGPPLAVGVESRCELLDAALVDRLSPHEVRKKLSQALPAGITIRDVCLISDRAESICSKMNQATYELVLEGGCEEEVRAKIAAANAAEDLVICKKTKKGLRYRDIKPLIKELRVGGDGTRGVRVHFTVSIGETGNVNCFELLRAVLGWPEERIKKLQVKRMALSSFH